MKTLAVMVAIHFTICSSAQVTHLVISQVYCNGAMGGSSFKSDYVELFNPTGSSVDITGWSLQTYIAPTWIKVNLPTATIPAGRYFLVSFFTTPAGTSAIPTADASTASPTNLDPAVGLVALVDDATLLTGACPSGGQIVDKVGWGVSTCYEGAAAAATTTSGSQAIFRINMGYTDNNINSTDFFLNSPFPRNSSYGASLLNMHLTDFTLSEENDQNVLSWKAECTGNTSFKVERSADGKQFTAIQSIHAKGIQVTQQFSYADKQLSTSTKYYRIMMNDANGKIYFSKVISARKSNESYLRVENFSYLNNVTLYSSKNLSLEMTIYSEKGQHIESKKVNISTGTNRIPVNHLLVPGIYYLNFKEKGFMKTIVFVKQ